VVVAVGVVAGTGVVVVVAGAPVAGLGAGGGAVVVVGAELAGAGRLLGALRRR
jgi:hypothetical protein